MRWLDAVRRASSPLHRYDDATRPGQLRYDQISPAFETRDDVTDLVRVAVGPIPLWQHIVNYVQPTVCEQAQRVVHASELPNPRVSKDQVKALASDPAHKLLRILYNECDPMIRPE